MIVEQVPWSEFGKLMKNKRITFTKKFREKYLIDVLLFIDDNEKFLELIMLNNNFQYRVQNKVTRKYVDFWETARYRKLDGTFDIGMRGLWEELNKLLE
jgi:hypothetical protein